MRSHVEVKVEKWLGRGIQWWRRSNKKEKKGGRDEEREGEHVEGKGNGDAKEKRENGVKRRG